MLAVKAGRASRRESTSWVDPQPTKGLLGLALGDDGLLHLTWKNRETNAVEDDLIIIPGDASFHKVTESPSGRVFVLKFDSSDQKHFYWLQDPSPSILEQLEANVNGLLQDPDFQPSWSQPPTAPLNIERASGNAAATATNQQLDNSALTESITRQFQALMQGRTGAGSQSLQAQQPAVALSDILSMSSLAPIFEPANAAELQPLEEFLPPDLPKDETATRDETLRRVIQSGPFRSTVLQLDRALATGLLGRLMPGFGLPEEAGLSVESFLRAIHDKARRDHEESRRE
ncbi:hypothetical protein FRC19_010365 [Serendipita sp. 401]|nr:hypothetical protein FRC19_010365 [Serendipita sp. 401]